MLFILFSCQLTRDKVFVRGLTNWKIDKFQCLLFKLLLIQSTTLDYDPYEGIQAVRGRGIGRSRGRGRSGQTSRGRGRGTRGKRVQRGERLDADRSNFLRKLKEDRKRKANVNIYFSTIKLLQDSNSLGRSLKYMFVKTFHKTKQDRFSYSNIGDQ